MTESRRPAAFYRTEGRVLSGSVIDKGASPAAIKQMAAAVGRPDVKVVVHYGIGRAVAAARPASDALHFSPSALTIATALHEIAHLVAGSRAQHGEEFIEAFLRLLVNTAGESLAAEFEQVLKEEGPGLWDPKIMHSAVA